MSDDSPRVRHEQQHSTGHRVRDDRDGGDVHPELRLRREDLAAPVEIT